MAGRGAKVASVFFGIVALGSVGYYLSDIPIQAAKYPAAKKRAKEFGFYFTYTEIFALLRARDVKDNKPESTYSPGVSFGFNIDPSQVKDGWLRAQPALPAWSKRLEDIQRQGKGAIPYVDEWATLLSRRCQMAISENNFGLANTLIENYFQIIETERSRKHFDRIPGRIATVERLITSIVRTHWTDRQWIEFARTCNRRIDFQIDIPSMLRVTHGYSCESVAALEKGFEAEPSEPGTYPKLVLARLALVHHWFAESYSRIPAKMGKTPLSLSEIEHVFNELDRFERSFFQESRFKLTSYEPIRANLVEYSNYLEDELARKKGRVAYEEALDLVKSHPQKSRETVDEVEELFEHAQLQNTRRQSRALDAENGLR